MGLRDKVLSQVGTMMEEEKKAKESKIRITPARKTKEVEGVQTYVRDVPTVKSEFKSVRHLIEYLLLKYPDIKFHNSEVLVKKYFPSDAYDTGTFMMIKLQWVRDKHLVYHEELVKDFPIIKGE